MTKNETVENASDVPVVVVATVVGSSRKAVRLAYDAVNPDGGGPERTENWVPRRAISRVTGDAGFHIQDVGRFFVIGNVAVGNWAYDPHGSAEFGGGNQPDNSNHDITWLDAFENATSRQDIEIAVTAAATDAASDETPDDSIPDFGTTEGDDTPDWADHGAAADYIQQHQGEGYSFLTSGGRATSTVNWDFEPLISPALIDVAGHPSGQVPDGFYTITAPNGTPNLFVVSNPDVRTTNQPAGVFLSAVSSRYAAASYPQVFGPLAQACAENGWTFRVTAFDHGKKARMDIDITTASGAVENLSENYRYGITVHNSLDGSGSLRVSGVAMRLVCANGMVATQRRNLLSVRHTKSGVGSIDFDAFANSIAGVIEQVESELTEIEAMRGISIDDITFERLLSAAQARGILTMPRATLMDNGDYNLSRGHLFRAAMQGWATPAAPWVMVEGDSIGTLFHAYQVLTGALTHKPRWEGPSTALGNGATVLEGNTVGISTLDNRLHSTHALLRGIQDETITLDSFPMPTEVMGVVLDT
jgi:hypothetical protein